MSMETEPRTKTGRPYKPNARNTIKKAGGRPSSYSAEIGARLCERIATSDYGLHQVCAEEGFPSVATVYNWLRTQPKFLEMYTRAKEQQGHTSAELGLKEALEATDAQLGRLRFDARKWQAAKLAPKVYGEGIQLRHANADGTGPVQVEQTTRIAIIDRLLDAIPLEVTRVESLPSPDDSD